MTAPRQRASIEEIVVAYRETGSVWKAAKRLGMAGQSVHERLRAVGYPLAGRNWTNQERDELRALIEAGLPMSEIARRLGRPFAGVAEQASNLGLRVQSRRERKLPRGAGFDKASTMRHMAALERYEGSITRYGRANGVRVELLAQALERHCPERWRAYVESRSDIPARDCAYCGLSFIPSTAKQRYHSRKCAADGRSDRAYFNGNRRHAVGMPEGVCQLCGREGRKGLAAHHVVGRENDEEARDLVALCAGCHNLVTLLASRKFVDSPAAWEALVQLAWLRHHGANLRPGDGVWAYVDIERTLDDAQIVEQS